MSSETHYLVTQGHSGWSADGTLPSGAVACTQAQAASPMEWTVTNGAVVAATPPAPTLADKAQTALAAGLTVTSSSTPSLNGTYSLSDASQARLNRLLSYWTANGSFPNGASTVVIEDMSGTQHTFDATQFKALFKALGDYLAALEDCIFGITTTLPDPANFGTLP